MQVVLQCMKKIIVEIQYQPLLITAHHYVEYNHMLNCHVILGYMLALTCDTGPHVDTAVPADIVQWYKIGGWQHHVIQIHITHC